MILHAAIDCKHNNTWKNVETAGKQASNAFNWELGTSNMQATRTFYLL